MRLRPIVLGLVASFLISSCARQEVVEPANGTWVGAITTEVDCKLGSGSPAGVHHHRARLGIHGRSAVRTYVS